MEHVVHTTAILVTNCLSFRFLLCILVVVWLLFAAEDFIVMVMCSSVWCPLLIIFVVVVECTSSCWCCAWMISSPLAILLLVFLLLLLLLLLNYKLQCSCWICIYFWDSPWISVTYSLCVCTWYIPYLPSNGTVRYICLHPSHCFTPTYYYIYITLLTVCRRFGNSTPIHQDTLGGWNEYR